MTSNPENSGTTTARRTIAVIDIGSTSVRMALAEIADDGHVRTLESLSQPVNLGRDTFTRGEIQRSTIEHCVRILKDYGKKLSEYQIDQSDKIRVVATSAVREARNRLAFLDRVYIATGLAVESIDEAEENRISYLSIQPFLQEQQLSSAKTLVMEVGGGSTELLLVRNSNVVYSHSYRLGSLRLRKMLETFRAPVSRLRHIMEGKIQRTIDSVREHIPADGSVELIAIGGDIRFAASQLIPDWNPLTLGRVPVDQLATLTDEMLQLTEDEIVQKYHLTYPDAETIGPALLAYLQVAREFDVVNVLVTNTNLRDGLLKELVVRDGWAEDFKRQILRSAMDLGRKFDFEEDHAKNVAQLASSLFGKLQNEHRLTQRHLVILHVAALLHEIGLFINTRSYHKHSMYLIKNSEIFGFGRRDLLMTALVARYHRRSSPKMSHEDIAELARDDRVAIAKMAGILRIAIALNDSRTPRIQEVECTVDDGILVITAPGVDDVALEQLALRQSGELFEDVFGERVLLRTGRKN